MSRPATFVHWRVSVHWNDNTKPTPLEGISRLSCVYEDIQPKVDNILFEAAKRTTGDRHPNYIATDLFNFHTEETE